MGIQLIFFLSEILLLAAASLLYFIRVKIVPINSDSSHEITC